MPDLDLSGLAKTQRGEHGDRGIGYRALNGCSGATTGHSVAPDDCLFVAEFGPVNMYETDRFGTSLVTYVRK